MMAEARMEVIGDQIEVQCVNTSHLLALIANVNRDPKKGRALTAEDFYKPGPRKTGRKQKADFVTKDVSIFKTVFVDHKLPDAKHQPRHTSK